jgi:hypothetical protein
MTLNSQGWLWVLGGVYFVLLGQGLLPLPRNIRAWFDQAGRERYRVALQTVGPVFLVVGVALLFGVL